MSWLSRATLDIIGLTGAWRPFSRSHHPILYRVPHLRRFRLLVRRSLRRRSGERAGRRVQNRIHRHAKLQLLRNAREPVPGSPINRSSPLRPSSRCCFPGAHVLHALPRSRSNPHAPREFRRATRSCDVSGWGLFSRRSGRSWRKLAGSLRRSKRAALRAGIC